MMMLKPTEKQYFRNWSKADENEESVVDINEKRSCDGTIEMLQKLYATAVIHVV